MISLRPILCLAILILAPLVVPAAKLPSWIKEAMNRECSSQNASAALLHNEAIYKVSSNSRIEITSRRAIRILKSDGVKYASVSIPYNTDSGKVSNFRAWLVYPNGDTKNYTLKQSVDIALDAGVLYSESRMITFTPTDPLYEKCTFACEYTLSDNSNIGQFSWFFQAGIPVLLSRVTYQLPQNWTLDTHTFNHSPINPTINKNETTLELRDLAAIKPEPLGPAFAKIAAYIAINLHPPAGQKFKNPRLTFKTWSAISEYYTPIYTKAASPDTDIIRKAQQLTAAATTLWQRIHPLARHAQNINYVSIQMGLARGGGTIPRPAATVLKTGYGDCKDKTALLTSLLAATNIESYPALAYSGDRNRVEPSWPSAQFNHVITAILVDDTVNAPAILVHPELGRLLLFDPTDSYTPLGEIHKNLQGSQILIIAADKGTLIQVPLEPPESSHVTRDITALLDATGDIKATINETGSGQVAVTERAVFQKKGANYTDLIRNWLLTTIKSATLTKLNPTDNMDENRFTLSAEIIAPAYAQSMRGKLLVFKPTLVSRRNTTQLTKPERTQPVIIESRSFSENTTIQIPSNYTPTELPPPVEFTSDFGRYAATCTSSENAIQYRRTLLLNHAEIPVTRYTEVRQFFENIRKSEQTPVVLEQTSAP